VPTFVVSPWVPAGKGPDIVLDHVWTAPGMQGMFFIVAVVSCWLAVMYPA
jgi:hypothetical protein